MHAHTHIYTHTQTHTHTNTHIIIHMHTQSKLHTYTYTLTYIHSSDTTHSLTHNTYSHLYETHHIYCHTHIYIQSHTYTQSNILTLDLCTHTHKKNTYSSLLHIYTLNYKKFHLCVQRYSMHLLELRIMVVEREVENMHFTGLRGHYTTVK